MGSKRKWTRGNAENQRTSYMIFCGKLGKEIIEGTLYHIADHEQSVMETYAPAKWRLRKQLLPMSQKKNSQNYSKSKPHKTMN